MFFIYLIDSKGNNPTAVSPDRQQQSVPSNTALATSLASALVGLRFLHIESNIWL